jgi:tetratricopeptide (TPR) repeat protein
MAAAGAAGFAGDATKAKALRERAAAINHRHPVVRIVAMRDEADARKRLAELDKLAPTGDAEIDALVDAVRTIALLDAGEFEAATVPASRASQLAPWLPTVREAGPAVVVARNRSRRRAGAATERRELLEAAEEYRRLCDDLRESRRFEESGGMLQRVAECQSLADRPDLARVSLSEALPDELSSGDVALMLAETAINAGAPELAERLVASYAGKHEAAELLRAHLGLRDSQRRRAAVETLDRLVKAGNYEAAVARMVAGVPRTEDVPWSDDAEAIVRRTEPVLAAFAKAEWHDRRDRPTEARRELARYADDPRALKELMVQFGQRGLWKKAASAARSLLQKGPDVAARVMVAQVLRRAGEGAEAEAILRQVLEAQDAHAAELADAFDDG